MELDIVGDLNSKDSAGDAGQMELDIEGDLLNSRDSGGDDGHCEDEDWEDDSTDGDGLERNISSVGELSLSLCRHKVTCRVQLESRVRPCFIPREHFFWHIRQKIDGTHSPLSLRVTVTSKC